MGDRVGVEQHEVGTRAHRKAVIREAAAARRGAADGVEGEFEIVVAAQVVAHADEHREILPSMVSQRGGALIQHLLRHLLVRVVREDVNTMMPKAGAVPKEAIVQFIAGGLYGLMMWWLSGKRRLSVEELDRLFRTLAIPAVKAAAP